MEIKPYQPDGGAALTALLQKKYGAHKNAGLFMDDARIAYQFCEGLADGSFSVLGAYEEGVLIGHIALIQDARLPAGEAFFGFLETPDDRSVFGALWEALLSLAKTRAVTRLKGPVSGSIWHQYRCIAESDGSEFFLAEPITEPYYYAMLKEQNPSAELEYFSASRTRYDMVLSLLGAASSAALSARGFSVVEADAVTPELMGAIAAISKQAFNGSWGYTELTPREFFQLYPAEKLQTHLQTLYLLRHGDVLIGYCSTIREDADTLIVKTICLLPEFQGQGLGNGLAYKVHEDAKKRGYKKILYALIREGNNVKRFPKDGTAVFRKYAAFEYML